MHHPRVTVPSELTAEQLRTAPFFEPGRLEPCGEEDTATMSRQIRKLSLIHISEPTRPY